MKKFFAWLEMDKGFVVGSITAIWLAYFFPLNHPPIIYTALMIFFDFGGSAILATRKRAKRERGKG